MSDLSLPQPPQTTPLLTEELTTISKWDELDIDQNLLRGIWAYGFEAPSPIQSKAIQPILQKRDVIAQSQSGCGKTGCFTIGALGNISLNEKKTQVLILSPTHELAQQTAQVVSAIGSFMVSDDGQKLTVKTIIGNTSIREDVEQMRAATPHVIVGTPGRVYDMICKRHIESYDLKMVVIDEADEMLSKGFKDQIYALFQTFNQNIQVVLVSATMPTEIYTITNLFMRNPVTITVLPEQLTLEGIRQYFVALQDDRHKYVTLCDIFERISTSHTIIYCNSIQRVEDLFRAMSNDKFPVCYIHGKLDSAARNAAIADFRRGATRVLISSDITARGIDVQQVSYVINFDIPRDVCNYLHRIGRSGRWGRKGTAINFVTRTDFTQMRDIEQYYHSQIIELPAEF